MMRGRGQSDTASEHRFVARDADGLVWDTTANAGAGGFVTWDDADYANYALSATSVGGYWFTATEPAGAHSYELWYWTGTLASSYAVWSDVLVVRADDRDGEAVAKKATADTTNTRVTTALPNAAPAAAGGLLTYGAGTGQLNPSGGAVDLVDVPNSNAVGVIQDGLATSQAVSELQSHGDSNWASGDSAGTGARTVTITVNDGADPIPNPIPGARVRVTRGLESHVQTVNGDGDPLTFNLDDGAWTVAITRAGYTFGGATLTVDGEGIEQTYEMRAVVVPPPAEPGQCTAWIVTRDASGAPEAGVPIYWRIKAGPGAAGSSYPGGNPGLQEASSDAQGLWQATVPAGATLEMWRGREYGPAVIVTIPAAAETFELPEIIGR